MSCACLAIRIETVEERKQTPPACVYHGFDLVSVLPEVGSDAFEMIHGLRTLVERCCDRAQPFHELQTLGVLREESKQLGKAVVDATIGFLTKSWKPCYMKTDMRKDMEGELTLFCGSLSSSTSLSLSEDSTKDGTGSQSVEGRSGSADAVRWKMEPAAHW